MMKYINISEKICTRIKNLKKSGKEGNALAQRATRIIEGLISGDLQHHVDAVGRFTKYGEKRIKNCIKFDLGAGYRLITLRRGEILYIPFLGTHDECQRWLETNSRLKKLDMSNGTLFRILESSQPAASSTGIDSSDIQAHAEDDTLPELSDQDLRRVFRGLIEAARKNQV
jgi:hypothetical protein